MKNIFKKYKKISLIFTFIIVAFLSYFFIHILTSKATDSLDKIHFLSSSSASGDSMIIESNGHYGLVDSFSPSYLNDKFNEDNGTDVLNYAKAIGVPYFDFVIMTHNHSDHIGGIPEIAELFNDKTIVFYKEDMVSRNPNNEIDDIEELSDGVTWKNHELYEAAIATFESKGSKLCDVSKIGAIGGCDLSQINNGFITNVSFDENEDFDYETNLKENVYFDFGDFKLNLYNLHLISYHIENINSIVTLVTHKTSGSKAALTGDIEASFGDVSYDYVKNRYNLIDNPTGDCDECTTTALENQVAEVIGNVDILKAAHHGGSSSNSLYSLSTYLPKYYIIQGQFTKDSNGIYPVYRSIDAASIYLANINQTKSYFSGEAEGAVVAHFSDYDEGEIVIENFNADGTMSSDELEGLGSYYTNGWKPMKRTSVNDETWAYVKNNKPVVSDWVLSDNKWYYINENGLAATNFYENSKGEVYYLCDYDDNCTTGEMLTGWQEINDATYYFRTARNDVKPGEQGQMVTGLAEIDNKTYYFVDTDEGGELPFGSLLKNGYYNKNNTTYEFDSNGVLTNTYTSVDIPTSQACNQLQYTGIGQTLASGDTGYNLLNNTASNAGTYTVTARLENGYIWDDFSKDDKSFECVISKVKHDAPIITNYSGTYDGSAHQVTLTNAQGKTVAYSTNGFNFSSTIPTRTDVGITNVYVKYLEDNNHFESDVSTGSISISNGSTEVITTNLKQNLELNYSGQIVTLTAPVAGRYTFSTDNEHLYIITNPTTKEANESLNVFADADESGTTKLTVTFTPSDLSLYSVKQIELTFNISGGSTPVTNVVDVPISSDYCKPYLEYTGESQTLTLSPATGFTFSNNTGINAGNYNVTATLSNGYTWSDNTTENKTITCSISKYIPIINITDEISEVTIGSEAVAMKLSSTVPGTFTYTGDEYVSLVNSMDFVTSWSVRPVDIIGSKAGYGKITVTFTPENIENIDTYTFTKNITVNKASDPIPTSDYNCISDLVYDGTEQTLADSKSDKVQLINNTATNAGSYIVTARLTDPDSVQWGDGTTADKTFTCSIAKADMEAPDIQNYIGEYDSNPHSISLNNATGKTVLYSVNGTTYNSTPPTRTNVGTTDVYVKYQGDNNHNESDVSTGSITITKINPVITVNNFTSNITVGYSGALFTVSSNVDGTFGFASENGIVSLNSAMTAISANQEYVVTGSALAKGTVAINIGFVPTDGTNYSNYNDSVDITINNIAVSVPTASNYCKSNIRYNGSEQTLTNDPGTGYTFINNTATNAGTYNVIARLNSGYEWANGSIDDVTISCEMLKANLDEFTVTGYNHTYDGQPHGVTVSEISGGTVQYKEYGGEWQNEPITRTNVGTTSVYVRYVGDQNHIDSSVVSGTIIISQGVPTAELNLVKTGQITQYNTEDFATGSSPLPGIFTFNLDDELLDNYEPSIHANANETVTFRARGYQAGNTTLRLRFTPDDTNYQSIVQNFGVTVWPSTSTIEVPTSNSVCLNNLVYNGSTQTLTTTSTPAYTFSNNTGTNVGNYNVTVSLVSGYKWSDNTTEDKTVTCSIGKANLSEPTITGYSGDYDGEAHFITASNVDGGSIRYSLDNNLWTQVAPSRTDAGTTQVFVKYIGDENHNDSSIYSTNIVINTINPVISSLNLQPHVIKGSSIEAGPISANVAGVFSFESSDTSILTVPITPAIVGADEQIKFLLTGVNGGDASYTITFTPSSSNYNVKTITTLAPVDTPLLPPATIPTAATHCKTNLKYNGSEQTVTNDPSYGYTFSNNVQTNAGTYTVTAKLNEGYVWSDNTTEDKTFSCSILSQDSYLNFDNRLIISNGYIKPKLNPPITYTTLKSLINTNGTITHAKADNEYVATCDTLSITLNEATTIYKLVITGDINKNGTATSDDVNLLFRHLRNKETLNDCQLMASDTTDDELVYINDVAKLYQFVNGKIGGLYE